MTVPAELSIAKADVPSAFEEEATSDIEVVVVALITAAIDISVGMHGYVFIYVVLSFARLRMCQVMQKSQRERKAYQHCSKQEDTRGNEEAELSQALLRCAFPLSKLSVN